MTVNHQQWEGSINEINFVLHSDVWNNRLLIPKKSSYPCNCCDESFTARIFNVRQHSIWSGSKYKVDYSKKKYYFFVIRELYKFVQKVSQYYYITT